EERAMLTLAEILEMERALRGRRVLSVLVDTSAMDPASRARWRTDLACALARLHAEAVRLPPGDRTALELCLAHLHTELEAMRWNPGGPAWVAYATTDDVILCGPVRARVQTGAFWQRGMVVAPLQTPLTTAPVYARVSPTSEVRSAAS
ncbi:MAG TPA: hypothetical protein VFZ21_14890, partial [Gemmatimonadaceae bacterium]|nr:hypothetical protein [Gemmatimonadaceae bacterium]